MSIIFQSSGVVKYLATLNALRCKNLFGVIKYIIPQIIHPYEFGHSVNKKTCLWLKGLPLLRQTKIVVKGTTTIWLGTGTKISQWYKDTLKEGKGNLQEVSRIRSTTFQGIADAMAEQWG